MRLVAWLSGRKQSNFEKDTPVANIVLSGENALFVERGLLEKEGFIHVDVLLDFAYDIEDQRLVTTIEEASQFTDWFQWIKGDK